MSAAVRNRKASLEEFIAYLDASDHKAEWLNGEIWDMAGGTPAHTLIAGNIAGEMRQSLKGSGCKVYPSDLIVQLSPDGDIVFPDVSVICGELLTSLKRKDFVRNPTLVVEVLSKDRADYDRGEKFAKYRSVPSIMEYVLVDQYAPQVDVFFRTTSGFWDIHTYTGIEETVVLQSIGASVAMAEIYRDVTFGG
jgi:Uma2 family endonuclease